METPGKQGQLRGRDALLLSIALLFVIIGFTEYQVLSYTRGEFTYPLDDAYIHMAIAKNLAQTGTWSINGQVFQSASSSILYPLLLAGIFKVFGVHLILPFLINLVAGIIILLIIQAWLQRRGIAPVNQLIILVAVVLLTPLSLMVALGMEHTLHVLLSLLLFLRLADYLGSLDSAPPHNNKGIAEIAVYAMLLTAIRFEGAFMVILSAALLMWRKRRLDAVLITLAGLTPILLFGLISLSKGSYFLPNPVLLKSSGIPQHLAELPVFLTDGIFTKWYYFFPNEGTLATERLVIALPMLYLFFYPTMVARPVYRFCLTLLIATSICHLSFANSNWFYRYEAYLVCAAITCGGAVLSEAGPARLSKLFLPAKLIAAFFAVFLLWPFAIRGWHGMTSTYSACQNIYDQNVQMGKFLRLHYNTASIGINDLGAVSFYTDGQILDYWGLASIEVAKAKRGHYYNTHFLDSITRQHKVSLAVVFDRLYPTELLNKWQKIATWHIDNLVVAGDPNLNFYAVDTTLSPALRELLQTYSKQLPSNVRAFFY